MGSRVASVNILYGRIGRTLRVMFASPNLLLLFEHGLSRRRQVARSLTNISNCLGSVVIPVSLALVIDSPFARLQFTEESRLRSVLKRADDVANPS